MSNLIGCDAILVGSGGGGSLPLITLYQRPTTPNATTSYHTGDTGWQVAQGLFDNWNDTTATGVNKQVQSLDYSAVNPFVTLLFNNPFGNKDRFTDENGLQVYGAELIIDNLTGVVYAPLSIGVYNGALWADQLGVALAFTDSQGVSGYAIPPVPILGTIMEYSTLNDSWHNWFPPANGASTARYIHTSCTSAAVSTSAMYYRGRLGDLQSSSKTFATTASIFYRIIPQPTTPNP